MCCLGILYGRMCSGSCPGNAEHGLSIRVFSHYPSLSSLNRFLNRRFERVPLKMGQMSRKPRRNSRSLKGLLEEIRRFSCIAWTQPNDRSPTRAPRSGRSSSRPSAPRRTVAGLFDLPRSGNILTQGRDPGMGALLNFELRALTYF